MNRVAPRWKTRRLKGLGLRLAVCAAMGLATLGVSQPAWAQVDFSGMWAVRQHEDQEERGPGGQLGDYLGLPINDQARRRAEAWDAALHGLPEWQCRPHGADIMWRSVHAARIWRDIDPVTGATTAWHVSFQDVLNRTVYMDGRPHPPEEAAHTWAGFSTGRWEGDMLTVTTTHLKEGYLRRNGIPRSDRATLTEHWWRHGDYLTVMTIVNDPVYLLEPFVQTTDYALDLHVPFAPELCEVEEETEHPAGWVPHRLPGTSTEVADFAAKYKLPIDAVRGGPDEMYPDFRKTMNGAAARPAAGRAAASAPRSETTPPRERQNRNAGEIHVLKVRENVYMLSGAGANVTALTFPQGVLLVDTGSGQMTDTLLATIRQLSDQPIVHIINTTIDEDHTGGNDKVARTGRHIPADIIAADAASGGAEGPTIVAHENLLNRMSRAAGNQPAPPTRAWPTETFHLPTFKLSGHYHGGEPIELFHAPAAHTDGDSLVYFRRADVLIAGDVFDISRYPVVDLARGGSINGVIDALNHMLDIAFPFYRTEGGTLIVPGHGRLCDSADVGYYRDMVTVIRDRVQDLIRKGMTLEQVKAAHPTFDYDPRYGSSSGTWTTDMFVEAVYKSLTAKK
jgi:cyclase